MRLERGKYQKRSGIGGVHVKRMEAVGEKMEGEPATTWTRESIVNKKFRLME
jgi:hypothetical protein